MSKSKKGLVFGFVRDLILSVSASLFSILLLRWVTSPIGGFTVHLLKMPVARRIRAGFLLYQIL